jgi:hypothetical protein
MIRLASSIIAQRGLNMGVIQFFFFKEMFFFNRRAIVL